MNKLAELVDNMLRERDAEIRELEEAMKIPARECSWCGVVFVPGDHSQRYCKLACYEASR